MPSASELVINTSATAEDMFNEIFGDGVSLVNGTASYSGDAVQAGIYQGGIGTLQGISPTDTGVILSTGNVADFTNTSGQSNVNADTGTDVAGGVDGDADMNSVAGQATFDAAILEADFIPVGDTMTIQLVFSSEEYLEFVNGGVNDSLGLFVNGVKVDFVLGSGNVSIDEITNTNNANLYLDNPAGTDAFNTEMDGLTTVLTFKADVNPGVVNSIKIGIADGGDAVYDSNVLIMANSVQSVAIANDDTFQIAPNSTAVFDPLANDDDAVGNGLTITQINGTNLSAGQTITLGTGEQVTLNADNTLTITSDGDITTSAFTYTVDNGAGTTDIGIIQLETLLNPPADGVVEGTAGADTIDGAYVGDPEGDRQDFGDAILPGTSGDDDSILGFGGDDSINAGAGDDTVEGGSGNDTIEGLAGDDSLLGGTGNDSLISGGGFDTLDGGAGDDTLVSNGGLGDNTLLGGDGADLFEVGIATNDSVIGGEGGTDADTISFVAANDAASIVYTGNEAGAWADDDGDSGTFSEIEAWDLSEGNDRLDGSADSAGIVADGNGGDDTLTGGSGSDTLTGGDGQNQLVGNDGDDSLVGNATDPSSFTIMEGGAGADTIDGTAGIWDIASYYNSTAGVNVNLDDALTESGGHAQGDTVIGVEQLDGSNLYDDTLSGGADAIVISGFGGDDNLYGGSIDNVMYGGDGADFLFGNSGNDTLDGDNGFATGGADTIMGGFGDDEIIGDVGDDVLDGGGGLDTIFGGDDSDTIWGQGGADQIFGENDADLINIQNSFGNDTIVGGEGVTSGTDNDTIDFGAVTNAGILVSYSGNEAGTATDGSDTISFSEIESLVMTDQDDTVSAGSDGSGLDIDLGGGDDRASGGSGDDSLQGQAGADSIYAGAGNDTVLGGTGDDELWGEAGDDLVDGGDGSDDIQVRENEGTDTIVGGEGGTDNDRLVLNETGAQGATVTMTGTEAGTYSFDSGNGDGTFTQIEAVLMTNQDDTFDGALDTTGMGAAGFGGDDSLQGGVGDDTFQGDAGSDTLAGGAGSDQLSGGDDADTFIVADGFGSDAIYGGEGTTTGSDADTVDASAVTAPVTVTFTGDEAGTLTDGSDTATFTEIEVLVLTAGDDSVDATASNAPVTVAAGAGNDSLDMGEGADSVAGEAGGDYIAGWGGADTLSGGAGDDTLVGGADADSLDGGADADSFLLFDGFGDDTIAGGETVTTGSDYDTIDLSAVTSPLTVTFTGDGAGTITDGVHTITFSEIERLILSDSADLVNAGADSAGIEIIALDGNDTVNGGSGADTIDAGDGQNSVTGGDGNDSLIGGNDADTLVGGAGNDSIEGGDGNDALLGGQGDDTLLGQADADLFVLTTDNFGTDSIVGGETVTTGADQDSINASMLTTGLDVTFSGNEAGTFTNGTGSATFSEIEQFTLTSQADSVDATATTTGMTLQTAAGDDTVAGGSGDDTVATGDGDDVIQLSDGFGNDVITGGEAGETAGDTLDLSGLTTDTTIDLTSADPEAGTVTSGGDTATFTQIENLRLGSGRDTLVLADGSGADTVEGFDLTDSGDGSTNDQLDVTGLTDAGGNPVNVHDVTVGDDGSGNAVLTFPNGESLTLLGVAPAELDSYAALASIGIPEPDYIVTGTTSGELIDGAYVGDIHGDRIDSHDALDRSDDDSVRAGDGDDTVMAGEGDDSVDGGAGADLLYGGAAGFAAGTSFTSDFNDLTSDPGVSTSGGVTSGGSSNFQFDGASYVVADPDAGGADIGDIDTVTITFTYDIGTTETQPVSYSFGDPASLAANPSDGLTDGVSVLVDPTTDEVSIWWNGTELFRQDTGYDPDAASPENATLSIDAAGLITFTIPGAPNGPDFTAQIPGDEWAAADTSAFAFVGGMSPSLSNVNNRISDIEFSGMTAGTGDDTLLGGLGDDTLYGQDGNDSLVGGNDNDLVDGGDGDDWLTGNSGNDTVLGGAGADSVFGAEGNDSMDGGAGDDSMEGWLGDDTMLGGLGDDYIDGAQGNDSLQGGDGNDTLLGGSDLGNDTLDGGAGDDSLSAGDGDDSLIGGTGADSMFGGGGDDTFVIENGFGNDTIHGWSTGETNGDLLDLSAVTTDNTVDLTSADPEAGTVTSGADTLGFVEIENLRLSAGRDTLVLADGSGSDTVDGFDMTDSGDGSTNDQLDVSGLTDAGGYPVNTADVTVSDDGSGNAVLTFPNGEAITLLGVAPAQLATTAQLASIGIPQSGAVDGTAADDVIGLGYADAQGDLVDGIDGDDDTIYGHGGNDSIDGGLGDDTILGGAGNDTILGDDGDDSVLGGDGSDEIAVEFTLDNDTLVGGETGETGVGDLLNLSGLASDLTVTLTAPETGTVTDGTATTDFSEFEDMILGSGNDSLAGSSGDDRVWASDGDDTLSGGDGDDLLQGAAGNDSLLGGAGNDTLTGWADNDTLDGGTGDDEIFGGDGDDSIRLSDGFGNDTIAGGELAEAGGDTLDLSGVTQDLTLDLSLANPETGFVDNGTDIAVFSEIENITLGGGRDTIVLADGSGSDTVSGFDMADSGDGSTNDQLDVSRLTSDGVTPVTFQDVTVGDDGSGNAVLTFPLGETITLLGVTPAQLATPAQLTSIGIPATDYTVEGTAAGDLITGTYTGDPDGDRVDDSDAPDGSQDDLIHGYGGTDVIQSGDGDDTVFGGADADTITADDGNDSVDGGDGDDQLYGGLGDDTLLGQAGDDSLFASTGADSLDGGAGDDTIRLTENDTAQGGDGDDLFAVDALVLDGSPIDVTGGEGAETTGDTLSSGTYNSDVVVDLTAGGTAGDPESGTMQLGATTLDFAEIEVVQTGAGDDTVTGSDGSDHVLTGDGADTIHGGAGDDTFDAGDGNDTVRADEGDDSVLGGGGDDALYGFEGSDTIDGGLGDDLINTRTSPGTGRPDTPYVDPGNPGISYSADADPNNDRDLALGGAGNDTILTGDDDDTVSGGTGADSVDAGFDDDSVTGDAGADTLEGNEGADTIDGGDDNDLIYGELSPSNPDYPITQLYELPNDGTDLAPANNADSLSGGAGDDTILGQDDDDSLDGGIGNDSLDGGIDNDLLLGGDGTDTLLGGDGRDTLDGGSGNDSLTGGDGDDVFVYAPGDGIDTIADFNAGNSGSLSDGDSTNNDFVDLSSFYDDIWELQADFDDDGLLNQSNATTLQGKAVDYSDNVSFAGGGIAFTGGAPDGSFFTNENTGVACFTPGTLIKTARGEVDVADIVVGDVVLTRDNGYQRVRWAGQQALDSAALRATPALRAVRIARGALGRGLPERDMVVSPQHRVVMSGPAIELLFGEDEVLVAALHLVGRPGITREGAEQGVTYVHFMFDRHELVLSDGAWTESFQPGDMTLAGLDDDQRQELFALFPDLADKTGLDAFEAARMSLKGYQARALAAAL